MSKVKSWVFENNLYEVGESLNELPWEDNNIYPSVWFEGRLYKALIKSETKPRVNRVCLQDIYYPNKKPYWTTIDKVYNIIKSLVKSRIFLIIK